VIFAGYDEIVALFDAAVRASSAEAITTQLKDDLECVLGSRQLRLPDHFRVPHPERYARRLLHRDPAGRYTAVVMTWGPGQGTAVHDHGGLWCVEGVVEGTMTVTQYDVVDRKDGTFGITPAGPVRLCGVGSAGHLIPPTDVHVLANALPDRTSLTLHVYGGSLDRCRIFVPRADGAYEEQFRSLSYDEPSPPPTPRVS
jgi:predicted metal-dependent enzyme (double-stranded beta helix superfamily)